MDDLLLIDTLIILLDCTRHEHAAAQTNKLLQARIELLRKRERDWKEYLSQ